MSLLFERAISLFDFDEARLIDAADDPLADAPDAGVDGEALATLVSNRPRRLADPADESRYRVPLHEPDSAELTEQFVLFEDHPLRGPVFVYRDGDDETPASASDLDGTALGRRLRFWLPDATPDERPSYAADGPTTTVSPISRPEDAPEEYLDRLRERLEAERDALRTDERERARHHTAAELAADGVDAVPELERVTRTDDGTFQVNATPPDGDTHGDVRDRFGVFEDDEVLIHGGPDAPSDFPVPATVLRFAGFRLDLGLREGSVDDETAVERYLADAPADDLGLSLLLNPVTYDRQRSAIGAVRHDADRLALLTGRRDATFAGTAARETTPRDPDLDPSQAFAAAAALYADDVCCVHGPPGTGKTRVLVEVVRRAVAHGERVLVCADSNQGVDNLLVGASTPGDPDPHSLHAHAASDELALARHRAGNSDSDLVTDAYGHSDEGRADVVVATTSGAAEFDVDAFDLAVVDEATQATVASTLVPFTRAGRTVLAGDHRQLPPFEPGVDVPPDRHHSLFERLYADDGVFGPSIGVRLDTQYRMHPAIARFASDHFYDGTLSNGVDVDAIDGLPPIVGVDVAGEERVDETGSHSNGAEADRVADVVDRLLDAGLDPGEIGVITPYDAQIGTIRDALGSGTGGVTVDTIDSFQGSEREAVVISFVRSNDDGDVGFLAREGDGPRRLNVALTRAERFCALVGDWETLRASHRNADATRLYADLHDYLTERDLLVDDADAIDDVGE